MRLLAAIAGWLAPKRWTGRLYLIDLLARSGADLARIPDPCLRAIVTHEWFLAKRMAALVGVPRARLFVEALEIDAQIIFDALDGAPPEFGADMPEHPVMGFLKLFRVVPPNL